MKFDWIKRSAELKEEGIPFAIATVINTIAPTSAKPMSKAIILADGTMEGWIGGGCSINSVISESLNCIKSAKAVILRLSPEESFSNKSSYKKEVFLTCESGGTLEFHIEPVLPMTKLIIYGNTPTTYAIANMGSLLNFDCYLCLSSPKKHIQLYKNITIIDGYKSFKSNCITIIGSQGENDIEAIKAAILSNPQFISMIISKKKASSLFDQLNKTNLSKERISKIKFPAGLDIGARTPEEIALSVLAEIIKEKDKTISKEKIVDEIKKDSKKKDPICGMLVDPITASDSYNFNGKIYYFCCSGCKEKFQTETSSHVNQVH